jgi:hypothetical protein
MERLIAKTRGDKNAFDGFAGSVYRATIPFDESIVAGPLRGYVEAATNYDFFRDQTIVPPWENDLDLDLRKGTEHASRLGQIIQSATHVDARKAEHVLNSQLGGFGRLAQSASNIGRDGRDSLGTLKQATGVLGSTPSWASRDVAMVLKKAKSRGDGNDPQIKRLKMILRAAMDADDQDERHRLARQAQEYATALRKRYE